MKFKIGDIVNTYNVYGNNIPWTIDRVYMRSGVSYCRLVYGNKRINSSMSFIKLDKSYLRDIKLDILLNQIS
jgi:hypothetical protein